MIKHCKMLVIKQLFISLAILCFCSAAEDAANNVYVIGLLPNPVFEKAANGTPPIADNLQTIRFGIANFGHQPDDVSFRIYLPDYAEITSCSMHSEGVTYIGKKTNHLEAEKVLKQARNADRNAVTFVSKRISDQPESKIQTTASTIHVRADKKMVFDLQYKETVKEMLEAGVKVLNKARVVLDFSETTVEDMPGELFSPNYPEPYPNNADITWLVRTPEGHAVRLNLIDLNIEKCCDRLIVYDGNSIHGNVLAVLTGTLNDLSTTVLQSTGNSLYLHMTSDCSQSRSGFKSTISVVSSELTTTYATTTTTGSSNSDITACNGGDFIYDSSGSIQSPNYPSAYESDMSCSWTIQLPSNDYVVNLTAINFDLEANYDYLNIYDGYSSALLALWTGHQSGKSILSTSNLMRLQFFSDGSYNRQGFSLFFISSYPPFDNCGGTRDVRTVPGNGSVSVSSPDYSSPGYRNNMRCSWQIYSPTKVDLSNIHIHLYYDGDHVNIYDGPSNNYPLVGNYTGNNHPSNVHSTGNYLFVEFLTDETGTSSGFYFDASAQVNETYLTASSNYNYVYSPNYPNAYENYAYYTWRLTASYSYYVVKAEVLDYDLETCCDYLRFYDGSSNSYPQLQQPGNNSIYYSSYRYMFIEFITDSSVTGRGFQIRYQQTNQNQPQTTARNPMQTTDASTTCSGTDNLTAYNGYGNISSPNYPGYYYNNAYCTWRIAASYSNYCVRVDVVDFDLESCCDHLRFYDGSSSSYPEISWQNTSNSYLYSSQRYMYVKFTSDYSVTRRGFQVRYQQVSYVPQQTTQANVVTTALVWDDQTTNSASRACSGGEHIDVYGGYGYIDSPNYPSYYGNNMHCTWLIHSRYNGYVVQLQVYDLYLASYDRVYLYDGPNDNYSQLASFYNSYYNTTTVSTGIYMLVKFTSDYSSTNRGFQFRYSTTYQPQQTTYGMRENP